MDPFSVPVQLTPEFAFCVGTSVGSKSGNKNGRRRVTSPTVTTPPPTRSGAAGGQSAPSPFAAQVYAAAPAGSTSAAASVKEGTPSNESANPFVFMPGAATPTIGGFWSDGTRMHAAQTPPIPAASPISPVFDFPWVAHTPMPAPPPATPNRRTVTPRQTPAPARSAGKRSAGGPAKVIDTQQSATSGEGLAGGFHAPAFVFSPGAESAAARIRSGQEAGVRATSTVAETLGHLSTPSSSQPAAGADQRQPPVSSPALGMRDGDQGSGGLGAKAPQPHSPWPVDTSMASSPSSGGSPSLFTPVFSFGSPGGSVPFLTPQSVFPASAPGAGAVPPSPPDLLSPQALFGAGLFSPGAGATLSASHGKASAGRRRRPAAIRSPKGSPDAAASAAGSAAGSANGLHAQAPSAASPIRILEEATARCGGTAQARLSQRAALTSHCGFRSSRSVVVRSPAPSLSNSNPNLRRRRLLRRPLRCAG
jgi:hypothetical protein